MVGYSSFQVLRLYEKDIAKLRPHALVVYVGENDWSDAWRYPDNAQPILRSSSKTIWRTLHRFAIYRALATGLGGTGPMGPSEKTVSRVSPEDYKNNLLQLKTSAERHGARVFFCHYLRVTPPRDCLENGYYPLPRGVDTIDTAVYLPRACGDATKRFFMDGVHPTAEGARLMAQAISDALAPVMRSR
ncbi:MAG: SGNH/GDSL hydrolase family protein [Deltaproteobacteria bacterium]|nr:SGNH/GDSL hydrolase family protein [Deltaproteobacteria bacterium]